MRINRPDQPAPDLGHFELQDKEALMKLGRWGMVMLLALSAVTACGGQAGGGDSGALKDVRVTVSNNTEPPVINFLVGQKKALFEKHGVRVTEIVAGQGGATTLRNLVSGDLALGAVSTPAVIEGRIAGTPVTVVGGNTPNPWGTDFYALANNAKVNTITDAKRWAFSNPGSITQAFTYILPKAAGIDPNTIERVAAGGLGEGIALLEAGKVDVTSISTGIIARNPGKYKLIVSAPQYLPEFESAVLTTPTRYLKDNPAVIDGLLLGLQDAREWIAQNPDEAGTIYAEEVGIDPEQGKALVREGLKTDYWNIGLTAKALQSVVDSMHASGFSKDIPWCDLFDLRHLPQGVTRELPVSCGS